MKRIKSRAEMLNALHLTQTEIQRLFGVSYTKAKETFSVAWKKDSDELKGRVLFSDKVRMSSVIWALGISPKEFDRMVANELKSGLALESNKPPVA